MLQSAGSTAATADSTLPTTPAPKSSDPVVMGNSTTLDNPNPAALGIPNFLGNPDPLNNQTALGNPNPLNNATALGNTNPVNNPTAQGNPNFLGNPASMLPFLTAQASSVFSLAASKESGRPASGVTSPSLLPAEDGGTSAEPRPDCGLPVGLDLGNGWKVVGLTSLADVTGQGSGSGDGPLLVKAEGSAEVSAGGMRTGCYDAGGSGLTGFAAAGASFSGAGSSEWKIVGLTSLNPGGAADTGSVPSNDGRTSSVVSGGGGGGLDLSLPTPSVIPQPSSSSATDQNQADCDQTKNRAGCDVQLPSLAELAAGTSDWKIAGITTLPASSASLGGITTLPASSASVVSGISTLPASSVALSGPVLHGDAERSQPAVRSAPAAMAGGVGGSPPAAAAATTTSSTSSASPISPCAGVGVDVNQWKVVGLTSLPSSSPSLHHHHHHHPSSPAPLPVVMATPSSLLGMPQLVGGGGREEEGWKVVGVVPLSRGGGGEESSLGDEESRLGPCGAADAAGRELQGEPAPRDPWLSSSSSSPSSSSLPYESPVNAGQPSPHDRRAQVPPSPKTTAAMPSSSSSSSSPRFVSSMLTRNAHNRVWAPGVLAPRKRERGSEGAHPLAFLRHCSSQLRNAVLKKNTVSTMLELKRAFAKPSSSSSSSSVLPLPAKPELLTTLRDKVARGETLRDKVARGERERQAYCQEGPPASSPRSRFFRQGDEELSPGSLSLSSAPAEQQRVVGSRQFYGSSEENDDKAVLASLYGRQANLGSGRRDHKSASRHPYAHLNSVDDGGGVPPSDDDPGAGCCFSQGVAAEMGQSQSGCVGEGEVTMADFDSHNVKLTNVDPWGVCTDEDLGHIAVMIADKGDNKVVHTPTSSSRKRKLSTPRKMIQ